MKNTNQDAHYYTLFSSLLLLSTFLGPIIFLDALFFNTSACFTYN